MLEKCEEGCIGWETAAGEWVAAMASRLVRKRTMACTSHNFMGTLYFEVGTLGSRLDWMK